MLKYEYINKEWIVSPTPAAKLVLLAGVLGAGITLVRMEHFLFRFDDSHPLRQVAWFCVMIFPFLGPRSLLPRRVLALGCS